MFSLAVISVEKAFVAVTLEILFGDEHCLSVSKDWVLIATVCHDIHFDGVLGEDMVDLHSLLLSLATKSSDSLHHGGSVLVVGIGNERRNEENVVGALKVAEKINVRIQILFNGESGILTVQPLFRYQAEEARSSSQGPHSLRASW